MCEKLQYNTHKSYVCNMPNNTFIFVLIDKYEYHCIDRFLLKNISIRSLHNAETKIKIWKEK